jgi:hypothetical protein
MRRDADPLIESISRIELLLGVLVRLRLSDAMESELKDATKRKLYDRTGDEAIGKLSTELGMSAGKISGIWQSWEQKGLLVKEGGRYRRVF